MTSRFKATLLLAPLGMMSLGTGARGSAPAPNAATATANGIRVTASTPLHAYPRGALVPVRVDVRNVSRATLYVPFSCGLENPNARVRTASGRLVFPPLIPGLPEPVSQVASCLGPRPLSLAPGGTAHWQLYAVVRGSVIVARLGTGIPAGSEPPSHWTKVKLAVRLTAADGPRLTVRTSSSTAIGVGKARGTGPMLVSDWWLCPGDDPQNGARDRLMSRVGGSRITADCAYPTEWHGVVGRMNHTVTSFSVKGR